MEELKSADQKGGGRAVGVGSGMRAGRAAAILALVVANLLFDACSCAFQHGQVQSSQSNGAALAPARRLVPQGLVQLCPCGQRIAPWLTRRRLALSSKQRREGDKSVLSAPGASEPPEVLEVSAARWGIPHVEKSNRGRVRRGVTTLGQSLLIGMPRLQNKTNEANGKIEGREAYPQRWRVQGEGRYEQTSSIRFLDGFAETFPSVVDASAAGEPPTRIPFLFGTKVYGLCLRAQYC